MTGPGERVSGDDRENIAAAVGVAIASVYLTCELGLLAAVTSAVRASLPFGAAVTMPALAKLRRQAAALLAAAEAKARKILADVGVPWDYQPVYPSPTPLPGTTPSFAGANLEPGMSS